MQEFLLALRNALKLGVSVVTMGVSRGRLAPAHAVSCRGRRENCTTLLTCQPASRQSECACLKSGGYRRSPTIPATAERTVSRGRQPSDWYGKNASFNCHAQTPPLVQTPKQEIDSRSCRQSGALQPQGRSVFKCRVGRAALDPPYSSQPYPNSKTDRPCLQPRLSSSSAALEVSLAKLARTHRLK
jgi:hypothetical protein